MDFVWIDQRYCVIKKWFFRDSANGCNTDDKVFVTRMWYMSGNEKNHANEWDRSAIKMEKEMTVKQKVSGKLCKNVKK